MVNVLAIMIGFLLVPFLIRKLGKESYGLIALVESTILIFEIATVSVRTSLARYATFTLSQEKNEDFLDYLSTGKAVLFFSAAFVLCAGGALSWFFPSLFRVSPSLAGQSRWLALLIVTGFTISTSNIVFWSVLYAKQRFDLINFAVSFGTLTRALAIFLSFSFLPARHVSLLTYGLIYVLFTGVQNLMIFRFHRSVLPGLRISLRRFKVERVREILSFSAYTSLQRLGVVLSESLTNILINLFYGAGSNAIYSVSVKFPGMMRRIFTETSWSLTPTFTDLAARNDRERIERLFFIYTKVLTIVTAPLCLTLILFSKHLVVAWIGKDFLLSGDLAALYTAPLLLSIPLSACGGINMAFGKIKLPSQLGLAYALVTVSFGVLLARHFSMGLAGFAVSTMVCSLLYMAFFIPYYACRTASISLKKYLFHSILKPLTPSLAVFGALRLVLFYAPVSLEAPIWVWCGISAAAVCTAYGACFALALGKDEKKFAWETLQLTLAKTGLK